MVGCLHLKIEGQSWLVDNGDRGLTKVDQFGRLTNKRPDKKKMRFFPMATVLEIFQQTITKKSLETFWYKLSAFH